MRPHDGRFCHSGCDVSPAFGRRVGIAAFTTMLVARPVATERPQGRRDGEANRPAQGLRRGVGARGSHLGRGRARFVHTFQISELYSSADGNIQFIELHESLGFDGEQFLAGHALTSKQGATTRTYTFPVNLPNGFTANKRVLIATAGFAALGIVTPDYVVPAPFLFRAAERSTTRASTSSATPRCRLTV